MLRAYRAVRLILARLRPSLRGGLGPALAQIVALAALAGATAGLLPAIMGAALDALLGRAGPPRSGAIGALAALTAGAPGSAAILGAAAAVLITVAVSVGSSRRSSEITGEITAALRVELLRAVLHASPRDVEEAGREAVAAKGGPPAPPGVKPPPVKGAEVAKLAVAREAALCAELIVSLVAGLPQAAVTLAVLSFQLVTSGAPLVLGGGALLFVASRLVADRASRRVAAAVTGMQAADAAIFAELGEALAATEDLRLLGARGEAVADFARAAHRAADARRRFAAALAVSGQIKSVFSAAAPLVLLLSLKLSGRAVPAGEIAAMLLVIPLLMARLEALDALRTGLVEREPLLTATVRLLSLPASPAAAPHPVGLDAVTAGAISFAGVRFTPKGSAKAVIDGLDLEIPAGALVGIAGPSGSGKSTLLRLLLRLDDPDAGAVRVDGADVRELDPALLPRLFAVLGQSSRLLVRSVAANLALGMETPPSEAEMREALSQVDLGELASSAGGRGLSTEVQMVPPNFSGGEQRRILLARLLLREARVLVLDEPEAGLPSATAEALLARVREVAAGRTTLVVTHAPHLLRSTFNVVLDGGRVADAGTHEELMKRSAAYRALIAEGLKAPLGARPARP
jgi:ABC-type transport system involved in cytochrome bd biosynthesis fused ATPase/permease subunit